jgi:hypothetical protein
MQDERCARAVNGARLLSQSGQYEAALTSYQNAYVATPVPWLLVNIGRLQQRLGRLEDACTSFHRFLDSEGAERYPIHRARAQSFLLQADTELASRRALALTTPPPKEPATPTKPPVYRRWWFWTLIGATVATAAVGAAIGAYSHEPDLTGTPIIQPLGK